MRPDWNGVMREVIQMTKLDLAKLQKAFAGK
jgi:hypothetical protein